MKHSLANDYNITIPTCATHYKRGRIMMASTTYNTTTTSSFNSHNNSESRIRCSDIMHKGDCVTIIPTPADDTEADKFHIIVTNVLTRLIAQGDKMKCTHKQFRSSSGRLPPITLDAYISRLMQYAPCERECFLAALLFLDRLNEASGFVFNSMNIHRSYLTALLLAAKFFEDQPCDNGYFATVGGVSLQELNSMEVFFLSMVDYRVSVNQWEYNVYSQLAEECVANYGRPKLYFAEPSMTPVTPDTTNSLIMHVTPAVPMVTTS